jgi:rubrerythrin
VTGESVTLTLLAEGRRREKAQTLFYRMLAAEAEAKGMEGEVERLNELHADEQHHLSRLTARLIELGGSPTDLRDVTVPALTIEVWEETAREREREEVEWYDSALTRAIDPTTSEVLQEILESELHHHRELRGKWMSA